MNKKPAGIYILSAFNLIAGFACLGTGVWLISVGNIIAASIFIIPGIAILELAVATFKLKKRALAENTVVLVLALLFIVMLLILDFTLNPSIYTGGERPIINIPLHISSALYLTWALYYLTRLKTQTQFTN